MRRSARLLGLAAAFLLPSLVALAEPSTAATAPPGFTDTTVHSLPTPTAITWTPDGRMLLTQDSGQLRVARNGVLRSTPAHDLSPWACTGGERGLLGVAVDPEFASNHFIYLFWTHNAHGSCGEASPDAPVNRVGRYVLGDDDLVVRGSEKLLLDHMPSPATNHNAGDLQFGADGLLYVSVGDGGCTIGNPTRCAGLNTNSRRLDIPNGKILRIRRNGWIPADNPYADAPGGRRCAAPAGVPSGSGPCRETYASGLRNPFRFARKPGTNTFYVNDVGQGNWEEIDKLVAGADYGWNVREGHCATGSTTDCGPSPYEDPIYDYSHADGCASITGGAFVPEGLWPAPYSGSYLFSDFVCGGIFRLVPKEGGGYTREPFLVGNRPVHLAFGPYAGGTALYYLDYFGGKVQRVSYSAGNSAPIADFTPRPDGLTVTLDGRDSYDPDSGDSVVSWSWDFGDGTTRTTPWPQVAHSYPAAQTYRATLRVTDTSGAVSAPITKDVYAGEHPPSITLTAPPTTARFAVGKVADLSATAADAEDGTLPAGSITWTVRRHHGTHDHPYLGPVTGSAISPTYPAPEDLASTGNSYLGVDVTATDSRGLTTTVTRDLLPRKVSISFATSPTGGRVVVNGESRATPVTLTSWARYVLRVNAPNQSIGGTWHTFQSWSDGGAQGHDISTPWWGKTYTATFGSS